MNKITQDLNVPENQNKDMQGSTPETSGAAGLVPAPPASSICLFLRNDGSWGIPESGPQTHIDTVSLPECKLTKEKLASPNASVSSIKEIELEPETEYSLLFTGAFISEFDGFTQWGYEVSLQLTDVDSATPVTVKSLDTITETGIRKTTSQKSVISGFSTRGIIRPRLKISFTWKREYPKYEISDTSYEIKGVTVKGLGDQFEIGKYLSIDQGFQIDTTGLEWNHLNFIFPSNDSESEEGVLSCCLLTNDGSENTTNHVNGFDISKNGTLITLYYRNYPLSAVRPESFILFFDTPHAIVNVSVASPSYTAESFPYAMSLMYEAQPGFSGSYNDLTDKPVIPPAVEVKGNKETAYRTGKVNLTPANIGALPDTGGTLTGELSLQPPTGEGGQIVLRPSRAYPNQTGIVLDQCVNMFRIFGQPSVDGSVPGVGTPLEIDPYHKTIKGGYKFYGSIGTNNLTLNDGIHDRKVLTVYDDGDGSTNQGSELVMEGAGNLFVGGGESPGALRTSLQSSVKTGESYTKTGEQTYITSDNNIYFYSNCNTIGNRRGVVYDKDDSFRPLTAGSTSLGSSSLPFTNVYVQNARLRPATSTYGGKLNFGSGDYVYLHEDTDNHLLIKSSNGVKIAANLTVDGTLYTEGNANFKTCGAADGYYLKGRLLSNYHCVVQSGSVSRMGTGGWQIFSIPFATPFLSTPLISIMPTNETTTENAIIKDVSAVGLNFSIYTPNTSWRYEFKWMAVGNTGS